MPYWLDGVIPLAWLLDDAPLKKRISGYIDYIVTHQHEDGWLGPRMDEKKEAADLWSQGLALKMLVLVLTPFGCTNLRIAEFPVLS